MNSFDDLLNTEILTELGTGGLRDAISSKVERKIGGVPDQIKAKFGSKAAKGRNNLRDMMHHLEDEFKVYCGEQSLNTQNAAVEDFLEFLRHRVQFNITDENFDRLAYGAAQDAPNESKIKGLEQTALKHIEEGKSFEYEVLALANFAKTSGGDAMLARKVLWSMARANPRLSNGFRKVQQFVGRPLKGNFPKLCQQIAQLIIKIGDRTTGVSSSPTGKNGEASEEEVEPMKLDVGEQRVPSPSEIKKHGWHSKSFFGELAKYGLSTKIAQKIGEELADTTLDTEEEMDECRKLLRSIKRENGINIIRILLQPFRGIGDPHGFISHYTSKKYPKLNKIFEANLKQKPGNWARDKDGKIAFDTDGKKYRVYDGSDLNKQIAGMVPDALTAQGLIVVLLGCFGKQVK